MGEAARTQYHRNLAEHRVISLLDKRTLEPIIACIGAAIEHAECCEAAVSPKLLRDCRMILKLANKNPEGFDEVTEWWTEKTDPVVASTRLHSGLNRSFYDMGKPKVSKASVEPKMMECRQLLVSKNAVHVMQGVELLLVLKNKNAGGSVVGLEKELGLTMTRFSVDTVADIGDYEENKKVTGAELYSLVDERYHFMKQVYDKIGFRMSGKSRVDLDAAIQDTSRCLAKARNFAAREDLDSNAQETLKTIKDGATGVQEDNMNVLITKLAAMDKNFKFPDETVDVYVELIGHVRDGIEQELLTWSEGEPKLAGRMIDLCNRLRRCLPANMAAKLEIPNHAVQACFEHTLVMQKEIHKLYTIEGTHQGKNVTAKMIRQQVLQMAKNDYQDPTLKESYAAMVEKFTPIQRKALEMLDEHKQGLRDESAKFGISERL